MGKGDRKTAKGKRFNSSYGNVRAHGITKTGISASTPVLKKTANKTGTAKNTGKKVVKKAAA